MQSTMQSSKKNCVTHKIAVWIFTFETNEEEKQVQESEDFDFERDLNEARVMYNIKINYAMFTFSSAWWYIFR